jgi:hypothetical protein
MRPLPDISTSAQFWAAIATIIAAPGAWWTYYATAVASRNNTYEGIKNYLAGIEAELDLLSDWASGEEGSQGYLFSKSQKEYTMERRDWFDPSRQIFRVGIPLIESFTSSPYLNHMTELVRPLVKLGHSVRRLFDLHEELRDFSHSNPGFYETLMRKMQQQKNVYTEEENQFMNVVFGMNWKMHVLLIGGSDSPDTNCLYKTFRNARTEIADFKSKLQPEPFPKWYFVLHLLSAILAFVGAWEAFRWLRPLFG